jgi:competence protein ComEC
MRHVLPALAGAYLAGLVLGDVVRPPAALALWLGVQALALGLLVGAWRRLGAALAAVLVAGAAAGTSRSDTVRALAAPLEAVVEARVESLVGGAAGPEIELGHVRAVSAGAPLLPDRVLVRTDAARPAPPWRVQSWVRVALRLAPVRARTNPGSRDAARALARRGIGAVAREVDPLLRAEIAPPPEPRALEALAVLRRRGAERLLREGPGGGLLAALGLGEARALDPESRRDLARVGLSHLVAVSGLHLWLVAGPVYLGCAALLRRSARLAARSDTRHVAIALAVAGGAAYAALTGLAAPVQRALVFLALLALAQLAHRRLAPGPVFAAAALAVALVDPAAPFAPGVQLSFAATAALAWSTPGTPGERAGLAAAAARGLVTALRVSASATAATAALVALHFGTVSPLGWLANGVAVPLTSLVLLPLALAAGTAAVAGPDVPAAAIGIRAAARLGELALAGVAQLAAIAPARASVTPGALAVVLSAGLAVACVRARPTWLRLTLAACAASAPALGTAPPLAPRPPRVVFLDVGQGDAALVQGRTAAVLVDGGVAVADRFDAGERVVAPALGALGVRALDLVVASHADLDHAGGLPAVLRAVPVRRVWLPPGGRTEPAFAALRAAAAARGAALEERAAGDPPLRLGDLHIETLWPPRAARDAGRNDGSLVLRVHAGARTVLLPGDLERAGESALLAAGTVLRADVLKLGHHGSRTSSSRAFLEAVSPALAIVSAPRHGRFGMPHAEVVDRLAAAGVPWRWTGRDGAVIVGLASRLCARAFAAEREAWRVEARSATGRRRRCRGRRSRAGARPGCRRRSRCTRAPASRRCPPWRRPAGGRSRTPRRCRCRRGRPARRP